jgi:error-prone DNA polymerase
MEIQPSFYALSLFEAINWDYAHASHSTHGHPLAPLRHQLAAKGLPSAKGLAEMRHGRSVRYAGIIICRQRPSTASGVTFMTMEDESGFVNLVVFPKVWERYGRMARTEAFIGVSGKLQKQHGVTHLIAERFWKPDLDWRPNHSSSRDFR